MKYIFTHQNGFTRRQVNASLANDLVAFVGLVILLASLICLASFQ
jgi:hypothetical protein